MTRFDVVVVGGGMMGAPCARHLAEAGHAVALVAAPEPAPGSPGPFASHHDAARIARRVAADPVWSRLSRRSIARYRDIEARTGSCIFREVGGVMSGFRDGPLGGFTRGFLDVAAALDDPPERVEGDASGWTLPGESVATWERRDAGWIDPRAMRAAQVDLAIAAGAQVFPQAARTRTGRDVTLADGMRLSGGHVVVATGPHVASDGLLPRRPAMTVWARTVAFLRLSEAEGARLWRLPSCIWVPDTSWDHELYALPPVRYPDGRPYLKVGGQRDGPVIRSGAEMAAWFAGSGDAAAGRRLLRELRRILPDVEAEAERFGPCAVVWTATGYPYVDTAGDGVTVLAGGNGAAAKCGDELGRLGAIRALDGSLGAEGYACDFRAVWEEDAAGGARLGEAQAAP